MTTKILALTDALGNLVRFYLMPGNRFDSVGVPPLIDGIAFGALIADKPVPSEVERPLTTTPSSPTSMSVARPS